MKIKSINFGKTVLENGFVIYYIKRPVPDVIYMNIYYRAGSGYEREGQRGISHFLEHLMFKGTKNFPGNYLTRLLSPYGGDTNAYTSWDSTVFYSRFPQCIARKVFEYEKDRMENLSFHDFEKELNVVLDEKKLSISDNPFGVFSERLFFSTFLMHPYRYPVIGIEDELKEFSLKDVKRYYDEFYTPQNAYMVLAGNVTDAVIEDAAKVFSHVNKKGKFHSVVSCDVEPVQEEQRFFVMERDDFDATVITVLFKTVPFGHEDTVYLDALSTMLGDGKSSYLYRRLVQKEEVFSSITSEVYETRACTIHAISGTVRRDIKPLKALEKLMKAIEKPNGLFTKSRFKGTLFNIYADLIYSRESVRSLGDSLGEFVLLSKAEDFNEFPDRLLSVELERLESVYKKYILPEHSTAGILVGK